MEPPEANPQPPEGINSKSSSGLAELTRLLVGLGLVAALGSAALVAAVGWLAPYIPFAWEEALAGDVVPVESTPHADAQTELRALADELTTAAELPSGLAIRVHLSDQATPNAFATLGGHIIVTRGLVEAVSSENALAMVIAHEIAHVAQRHPIQALGRGAVLQLVWSVLAGTTGQAAVEQVLGRAGLLSLLSFNREMERSADRAALATLQRHYGHTQGAAAFFRQLQERAGRAAWADFLRTHPHPSERLEAIEAHASGQSGELTPLSEPLRALGDEGAAQ